jgi:anti-anti-sigma regulatory factor
MDDYKIKFVNDIAIVTVDILVATHRDVKPFWDFLANKSIVDWDKIIIDISFCTFIDSTFIGIIVKIFKTVTSRNGQVKLIFPERIAMNYLHSIGVTKMLDCFNDLTQALNSFDSNLPTRKISFQEELPESW